MHNTTFDANLDFLRRYRLEPLLRSLDREERNAMQITQAQIDTLTQEESDLAASVMNAVQRSQAAGDLAEKAQEEIVALQGQVTADGTPVDTSKVEEVLKAIKAQVDGIAAPSVVVPPAEPAGAVAADQFGIADTGTAPQSP